MKILMVCLGNICRSPLAEGIMQSKINEYNLDWKVDSAGTGAYHVGEAPDPRSIEVAEKYGIDISKQKARQFEATDLRSFDLIFAMDATNYSNIVKKANTEHDEEKVDLIMNSVKPGFNMQVTDPYYGAEGFENVYLQLDEACEAIVKQYQS